MIFCLTKEASKNKTILKNLFEKYHFDKRGDLKINDKSETTFASIFSYDKNMFRFRYLRDYIISGSKKMDYNLTPEKIKVLDFVDEF